MLKRKQTMKLLNYIFLLLPSLTFAQMDNQKLVDSLRFVTEMPYACGMPIGLIASRSPDTLIYNIGCGDHYFWQAVKGKKEIIPFLIDKIDDTTMTEASVSYFGGRYTVADVAYTALQEIIKDVPTFELLKIKFDTNGCGYCSYWNYLREDIKNRKKFKVAVSKWYDENKENLVWVSSKIFLTCDVSGFNHPNGGHLELKK
jgi:hypothetical protein